MRCIFCDVENEARSVEHIVSESFGNKKYVLEKSRVCDMCNSKFSKFEGTALTNTVFIMERARFGIETKSGKNAKGDVGGLKIQGNENFEKNLVSISGVTADNFKDFNPETQIGHLHIKTFDKSEVATSRLLLKTGLEALFTSQRKIFERSDFSELKSYMNGVSNVDWPFVTSDWEPSKFSSIPRFYDKYLLNQIRCHLSFYELDESTLLFKFKYGAIPMVINLINRKLGWIVEYRRSDKMSMLFPEHYIKKIEKITE